MKYALFLVCYEKKAYEEYLAKSRKIHFNVNGELFELANGDRLAISYPNGVYIESNVIYLGDNGIATPIGVFKDTKKFAEKIESECAIVEPQNTNKVKNMKPYKVPCEWMMTGYAYAYASSKEKAVKITEGPSTPTPNELFLG